MFIDLMDRMCFLFFLSFVDMFLLFLMAVSRLRLHALHLFFLHGIHTVHQFQSDHIRLRHGFQDLFHPGIVLPAHIDEHITVLYGDDILGCRLIGMSLFAGFKNHFQVHLISRDLADKIILRKDRRHNADLSFILLPLCPAAGGFCSSAACQQTTGKQNATRRCQGAGTKNPPSLPLS